MRRNLIACIKGKSQCTGPFSMIHLYLYELLSVEYLQSLRESTKILGLIKQSNKTLICRVTGDTANLRRIFCADSIPRGGKNSSVRCFYSFT